MSDDYRILLAIDLKPGTDRLLAETQRYAKALNATVDVIHVGEPDPAFVGYIKVVDVERQSKAHDLRAEHQQTQALGATLRASGIRVDRTLMVQGPILPMILEQAQKFGSDLLILGSHHHGALYRLWYGDTATDAVKQPPCAVLVVPV